MHLAAIWARNLSLASGGFPDEYRKDVAAVLTGEFNSHLTHGASSLLLEVSQKCLGDRLLNRAGNRGKRVVRVRTNQTIGANH